MKWIKANKLEEQIKDYIKSHNILRLVKNSIDKRLIKNLYWDNIKEKYDAYAINVKNRGFPDPGQLEEILSQRLNVDKQKISDIILNISAREFDIIVWDSIESYLNKVEDEEGISINSFGRSGGYWGIPIKDMTFKIRHKDSLINVVVEEIAELVEDDYDKDFIFPPENNAQFEHKLVRRFLSHMTDDDYYLYSPEAEKVDKIVNKTVSHFSNQENWADVFEPHIKEKI